MDICKTCGKYMDLVGRVHRCSPQSAVNTAVNTDDAVNTAVNRRGAYPTRTSAGTTCGGICPRDGPQHNGSGAQRTLYQAPLRWLAVCTVTSHQRKHGANGHRESIGNQGHSRHSS
jgi:hypothetical protein